MISAANEIEENGNNAQVLQVFQVPSNSAYLPPGTIIGKKDDNKAKAKIIDEKGGMRGMTEDNSLPMNVTRVPEPDCNSNVTMSRINSSLDTEYFLGLQGSKYQSSIFSQNLSYDDLARNIDANLAEIDMEDFRSEDIHSILNLPAMFGGEYQPDKHGEQIASMSGSLLLKFDALDSASSVEQRSSDSDVSMCRSGPLFSPARDAPPLPSFSVDSLDCDSYDEHELMLTCQANKDNYTITFEGSFTHCSDDSDYHDAGASDESTTWPKHEQQFVPNVKSGSPDKSMVQSDYVYTTWRKLKHTNDVARQTRRSGTPVSNRMSRDGLHTQSNACPTSKSQSLPNLLRRSLCGSGLQLSQLNVSGDSDQCVPVFDLQASQSSSTLSSQHSFSLMRLFIQQKGGTGSLDNSSISVESGIDGPLNSFTTPSEKKLQLNNCSNGFPSKILFSEKEEIVQVGKTLFGGMETNTNVKSIQQDCYRIEVAGKVENSLSSAMGLEDLTVASLADEEAKKVKDDDGEDSDDVEMISIEENKFDGTACNNSVDMPACTINWESHPVSVDVINNFFSGHKKEFQKLWKNSSSPMSLSQGTQTKQLNDMEVSPTDTLLLKNVHSTAQAAAVSSTATLTNSKQDSPFCRKLNMTITKMRSFGTQIPVHVTDQAVQTSLMGHFDSTTSSNRNDCDSKDVSKNFTTTSGDKKSVLVCYPNYALPDLSFLRSSLSSSLNSARMYLMPQTLKSLSASTPTSPLPTPTKAIDKEQFQFTPLGKSRDHRPHSCPDIDSLRNRTFQHIHDWDSLSVLLPREVRSLLGEENGGPDPATDVPRFNRSERGRSGRLVVTHRGHDAGTSTADLNPPPLPKRSISLPSGHGTQVVENDVPRSILRKPSPSRSDSITGQQPNLKEQRRRSLQEMLGHPNKDKSLMNPLPCNSALIVPFKTAFPNRTHLLETAKATLQTLPTTKVETIEKPFDDGSSVLSKNIALEQDLSNMPNTCEHSCCLCERHRSKKSVSFSERVCIRQSLTPEGCQSPAGSPTGNIIQQPPAAAKESEVHHTPGLLHSHESEVESPPNEFCISPLGNNSPCSSPRLPDQTRSPLKEVISQMEDGSIADLTQKKALVLAVSVAVDVLLSHFGQARDSQEKYQYGNSSMSPGCGQKVLKWLCPTLYALLSDCLQPKIYSLFGHIPNSVWAVIEASVQSGLSTRALNDLVIRLNAEEELKENVTKFNAFIFGLLNIRSLDTWLAYLRSRELLVMKHYQPHSFLSLANAGGRLIFDDLLLALQPLSTLPFELDLLFEVFYKNSPLLPKWEDESCPSEVGIVPSGNFLSKRPQSSHCKVHEPCLHNLESLQNQVVGKETKELQNQKARQSRNFDASSPSMFHMGRGTMPLCSPRLYADDNDSTNGLSNDLANNVKRRCSGIQIGSRFMNTYDRRSLDYDYAEISLDYELGSNALSNNFLSGRTDEKELFLLLSRPKPEGAADGMQVTTPLSGQPLIDGNLSSESRLTKDAKCCQRKSLPFEYCEDENQQAVGQQFKELQQKWEQLSSKTNFPMKSKVGSVSIMHSENESNSSSNVAGLPNNRSRIPRLVMPSRQLRMEEFAISFRSSASGQSTNSQDIPKEKASQLETKLEPHFSSAIQIESGTPAISNTPIYEPVNRASVDHTFSPRKRLLSSRTLSAPAVPPSSKGLPVRGNKNHDIRRQLSPPRTKSGLPRKIGSKTMEGLEQDAICTALKRK